MLPGCIHVPVQPRRWRAPAEFAVVECEVDELVRFNHVLHKLSRLVVRLRQRLWQRECWGALIFQRLLLSRHIGWDVGEQGRGEVAFARVRDDGEERRPRRH